ncbi:hypothetical protein E2C01_057689 [Portunus trituberculatus]|uniref:Uncharacterized protein n=1 Tax=Portunus trituberculatus TaxID=210409 RepID=A0A5B7GU76_PORTR|nr:hypothetical protein [Portunus trituberculatus]
MAGGSSMAGRVFSDWDEINVMANTAAESHIPVRRCDQPAVSVCISNKPDSEYRRKASGPSELTPSQGRVFSVAVLLQLW